MPESSLSKKITKAIRTGDQLVQDLKALAKEVGLKKKPEEEEKKDA